MVVFGSLWRLAEGLNGVGKVKQKRGFLCFKEQDFLLIKVSLEKREPLEGGNWMFRGLSHDEGLASSDIVKYVKQICAHSIVLLLLGLLFRQYIFFNAQGEQT